MSEDTRQPRDDTGAGRMPDDPADTTQPAEGGLAEVIQLPGAQGGDPSGAGDDAGGDPDENEAT